MAGLHVLGASLCHRPLCSVHPVDELLSSASGPGGTLPARDSSEGLAVSIRRHLPSPLSCSGRGRHLAEASLPLVNPH